MASRRTWSRYSVSSIGSMKRKLSIPLCGCTLRALTLRYSSGSGTSRSPGATQWPTTPGPIMSAMNSYSRPFQVKRTGQELPRRSSSAREGNFLAGGEPMADDAGANHVGNEFVFAAVPGEEDGTRASATIEFSERMKFFGGEIYFVLRNASGPEQAHDFDIFFRVQSGEDGRGILAQVTGGA